MGLVELVQDRRTGTERIVVRREGARRPVTIDVGRLMGAISRGHVEIMRDDLGEVLHSASADDVEYVFGDSVASISADGEVTFEHGPPRRFELVIGADGLHSTVRRLVFGTADTRWLGAYLAVASIPNHRGLRDTLNGVVGVDRLAGTYSARHMPDERSDAFYFDSVTQLRLDGWCRGRVAPVGDAGYCPGPAVGGSTSCAAAGTGCDTAARGRHSPY